MKLSPNFVFIQSFHAISLLFIVWVMWLCQFGVDITDEGFYLNTLRNPSSYLETTSYFGFAYHWLFNLLDGNVIWLRRVSAASLIVVSWLVFYRLLSKNKESSNKINIEIFAISTALSLTVLFVFAIWLPTPNYNVLNLLSILLIALGLIGLAKLKESPCYLEFTLISLGGLFSLLAKPTSAGFLFIFFSFVLMLIFFYHRSLRSNLVKSILATAPILIIILIVILYSVSGSVELTLSSLRLGIENGNVLSGKDRNLFNQFWRGSVTLNNHLIIYIMSLSVITLLCNRFSKVKGIKDIVRVLTNKTCVAVSIFSLILAVFFDFIENPFSKIGPPDQYLILCTLSIIFLVIGVTNRGIVFRKGSLVAEISLLLLSLPYAYVIGTSNNYFNTLGLAGVFTVIFVVHLIVNTEGKLNLQLLTNYAVLVLLLSFLTTHESVSAPYRQPSSLISDSHTEIHAGGLTGLKVSPRVANYFDVLNSKSLDNGFSPGGTIIDMTGASPSTIFSLGAKSIGSAWYIGGYDGSDKRAIRALMKATQNELETAWVLTEPNSSRALNFEVLTYFGLDINLDYILVAEVPFPSGFGGRKEGSVQRLYKPKK